jgi:hypothetical protein
MNKNYFMKKIIRLTESDLSRIVRRVINESVVINNATFSVNGDGTVSITVDKKTAKIRFSKFYMDINVASLSKTSDGGCKVKSKNGTEKTLSKENVNSVINFVKGSSTEGSTGGVDMEKV